MTEVLRIVEHVIDPPPSLAREVAAARRAIAGCGYWPTSGVIADYRASTAGAGREIDRIFTLWHRWRRRFAPTTECIDIEDGPPRLYTRYQVASQLFRQRAECVRLLVGEPQGQA